MKKKREKLTLHKFGKQYDKPRHALFLYYFHLDMKVSKIVYNEQRHRKLEVKAISNTYLMGIFFMP